MYETDIYSFSLLAAKDSTEPWRQPNISLALNKDLGDFVLRNRWRPNES